MCCEYLLDDSLAVVNGFATSKMQRSTVVMQKAYGNLTGTGDWYRSGGGVRVADGRVHFPVFGRLDYLLIAWQTRANRNTAATRWTPHPMLLSPRPDVAKSTGSPNPHVCRQTPCLQSLYMHWVYRAGILLHPHSMAVAQ